MHARQPNTNANELTQNIALKMLRVQDGVEYKAREVWRATYYVQNDDG